MFINEWLNVPIYGKDNTRSDGVSAMSYDFWQVNIKSLVDKREHFFSSSSHSYVHRSRDDVEISSSSKKYERKWKEDK